MRRCSVLWASADISDLCCCQSLQRSAASGGPKQTESCRSPIHINHLHTQNQLTSISSNNTAEGWWASQQRQMNIQMAVMKLVKHVRVEVRKEDISTSHRPVKQQLHEGHTGCTKMRQLARRFVWWPGLDAEPRRSLGAVRPASRNERLSRTLNATGQFLQVGRDDFDENWGAIGDALYAKYAMMSSEPTVAAMRAVSVRLGLPLVLVTDDGSQLFRETMTAIAASNPARHTCPLTDWSKSGLGYVLIQKHRAVC